DDAVGRNPYRTAVAPRRPVALKQITHRRQMIGQQQIVMRSESDEPATRFPQRHIAVRVAEMRPLRQIEEPDPRVGKARDHVARVIRATVGDHKQLEIPLRLREYRGDGKSQHIGAVMGGKKNRETRRRSHPPVVPAGKRYGISGVSSGRRYLSGDAWSYWMVGKFTTTTSRSPIFRSACHTFVGTLTMHRSRSDRTIRQTSLQVGLSGRGSNSTSSISPCSSA